MASNAPARSGLALLVLGTGGPFLRANHVSSGYVVCVDGAPRVVLDAGGGAFERLGRYAVDLSAIDLMLYTHTHIDHTGGIPPIIFAMYMQGRKRSIRFAGPAGRERQPGCAHFVNLLFGDDGAWAYMNSFDGFATCAQDLASDPEHDDVCEIEAPEIEGLRIRSVAVPHGMMPAVGYRFEYEGKSLTFSGDIAGAHPSFVRFAGSSDVLLHDMALPQREVPHGHLHAKPLDVGSIAADAHCRRLLLTHFLPEIEDEVAEAIEQIRARYSGPVDIAHEGQLFQITG